MLTLQHTAQGSVATDLGPLPLLCGKLRGPRALLLLLLGLHLPLKLFAVEALRVVPAHPSDNAA